MSLVINQNLPVASAPSVTAGVVLQPGSVITAKVLQIIGTDQARISIGGQSIDVQTQVPLQAGQSLQLAVSQTSDGIRLAVVPQPGTTASQALANTAAGIDIVTLAPDAAISLAAQAPGVALASLLTPQEVQAVSTVAQSAATQQASLAPLFANLTAASGLDNLPPQLQQAVAQVLAQRPSLDTNLTGADVQQAFKSSGLFLEASLASGAAPSATTPDLKAALVVLRQVLTTTLSTVAPTQDPLPQVTLLAGQGTQPTILPDSKAVAASVQLPLPGTGAPAPVAPQGMAETVAAVIADLTPANPALSSATPTDAATRAAAGSAALSLLQEVVQASPLNAGNLATMGLNDGLQLSLLPAVAGLKTPRVDDGTRSMLPPPPVRGALPTAQPVAAVTIVASDPPQTTLRHLLQDTDAAIARQTLLQVASLPDRNDGASARLDPAAPRWNFEIPFAMPQTTAIAHFEISRDGGSSEAD